MEIVIYRGTTPTLKCILPAELTQNIIKDIWLTFKFIDIRTGKSDRIDYYLSEGQMQLNENVLSLKFTQEMTLNFKPHDYKLDLRILLINGSAIALKNKKVVKIINVLNDDYMGEKIVSLVLSDSKDIEFESTFNNISDTFEADFNTIDIVEANNYVDLINKPTINGETVVGDKTLEDYHLESLNSEEIISLWNDVK